MDWRRSLPSGTKDKLFRESNGAYQLEKQVNEVIKKRGYQRIDTPVIEFEDVFKNKNKKKNDFYRFFDKHGRLLILRPDMTKPIGRVIATTGIQPPLKLAYSGKVFRANDEMQGEQNELMQAGIELIGYSSMKAEIECLACATDILESLQIEHFHFELGHAAIFKKIVSILDLSQSKQEELEMHVNNKSISDLSAFTKQHPSILDDFICGLPLLFGEAEDVLKEAQQLLPNPSPIDTILAELSALITIIKAAIPSISLTVDLGLVALMNYYTGVLFNGYADRIPEVFLRGGRYDQLTEQFGHEAIPAIGFGINLDIIASLQYQTDALATLNRSNTLVHSTVSLFNIAMMYIKKNPTYQLSLFETLPEALAYAKKWDYEEIIYLSDEGEQRMKVVESDD